MKCTVCKKVGKNAYLKHKPCIHYICEDCLAFVWTVSNINATEYACFQCMAPVHIDYNQQCPNCFLEYSERESRAEHVCDNDEGIFDM